MALASTDSFDVLFSSRQGSIEPKGAQSCKVYQTINVYFEENDDYYFKNWQVSLNNRVLSQAEAAAYVKIADYKKADTTIKFLKKTDNLKIEVNSGERPSVLEGAPRSSDDGVNRDSRVSVTFTRKMDESSIYYTDAELRSLGVFEEDEYLTGFFTNSDVTEICNTKNGSAVLLDIERNKCYGYRTEAENELTTVFKNIQIYDRSSGQNLLKHYKAPYSDSTDKSVLRIDTKKDNDAPPAYTDIVVKVLGDMRCEDEGKYIPVPKQYLWPYNTNNSVDNENPVFNEIQVCLVDDDGNKTALKTDDSGVKSAETGSLYDLKNKKLVVKGSVYDKDSGPAYVEWKLSKVKCDSYYSADASFSESGTVKGLIPAGKTAYFGKPDGSTSTGCNIDLDSVLSGKEGCHTITFTAYDKAGNKVSQQYYFIYDDIAPQKVSANWSYAEGKKIVLNYSKNSSDVSSYVITDKTENSTSEATATTATVNTTSSGVHIFGIKAVDLSGNESEEIEVTEASGGVNGAYVYYIASKKVFTSINHYHSDKLKSISGVGTQVNRIAGIVYDDTDQTKVKIIGLQDKGPFNKEVFQLRDYNGLDTSDVEDGLQIYEVYSNKINDSDDKETVWYGLRSESSNCGSKITWYLPTKTEMMAIIGEISRINGYLEDLRLSDFATPLNYASKSNAGYLTATMKKAGAGARMFNYVVIVNGNGDGVAGTLAIYYYRPIAQLDLSK